MRIAVMGAGGTGGYFGALLARAGEDVAFIARGAHLEAIRERGLQIKSPVRGDFTVQAKATDDPAEVGPVDAVLFCVKAFDNAEAARRIRPMVGPEAVVVSVQNGIDNEDVLGEILGRGAVLGAIAQVSSIVDGPGVIGHRSGPDVIRVGELEGGVSPRVERLVEVLKRAGINADPHPNIRVALWSKFVFICAVSGVTALTRLPMGIILADPETTALLRGVMEEAAAVGRARGITLPDDLIDQLAGSFGAMGPQLRGSMAYDLEAGRRMELETLQGTVVRLGRELGVPTPLNFAVYAALRPYANGTPNLPTAP
jgi:2-dehydropantoate 2-reductase